MGAAYRRVLLKLSGEALSGSADSVVDPSMCQWIAAEIAELHREGVQFGIVIGGGNIFRGAALCADGIDRTEGDSIGMLATVINGLLMRGYLEAAGVPAVVMSANTIDKVTQPFTAHEARRLLSQGTAVIAAGGTGNPFFTTDTAASLRCAEMQCDALLKATKVDGIYTADPVTNPSAVRLENLTYEQALSQNLRIMDATAFSFCREQRIPIVVFRLSKGNLRRCVAGESVGSIVTGG
jgi:uridylate kinase